MLAPFLGCLLLAGGEGAPALTRAAVLDRFQSLATEGVETERLRGVYNLLARKVLERYPQLASLAAAAGIPARLASDEELAREAIRWLDGLDPRMLDLDRREMEALLAFAARGLRAGRLSLLEGTFLYLTRGQAWRRLAAGDRRDLELLRGGLARAPRLRELFGRRGKAHAHAGSPPGPLLDATLLRTLAAFAEDFLSSYEQGSRPSLPVSGDQFLRLLARGLLPDRGVRPRSFAEVEPDPRVVRGIERLYADLSREVLGFGPEDTARLVASLPEGEDWVAAAGGYLVRAGEPLLLPFHRVGVDYLQLYLGTRVKVVWLRDLADLERILADPAVKRLVLSGHGSMQGYSYEGATGPPEETLARLLAWARGRAGELAPRLETLLGEGDAEPLFEFLAGELDAGWRRWRFEDTQRVAAREGFVPKERMVLYACSVDEIVVQPSEMKAFRKALLEELEASGDAGRWLDFREVEGAFLFAPLWPAAGERFRAALPALLAAVRRRLGNPFHVEARPDFVKLLARESRRFPGTSSAVDFAARPDGWSWNSEDLAAEVRKALAAAD